MLNKDQEYFDAHFSLAASYLRAASLRRELYALLMKTTINAYEQQRIDELSKSPACNEPWFVRQLDDDLRRGRRACPICGGREVLDDNFGNEEPCPECGGE
jgi:hypothetical protein